MKVAPYLKNRAGGVVQMVEHLHSKHEALSLNPIPQKIFLN
jgi:hypothetical protein